MAHPVPIFSGHIENHKLVVADREGMEKWISHLNGKSVQVVIRRYRKGRSLAQNRWYWGVIVPLMADHCGYDDEEMHSALRMRFLMKYEGLVPTIRSTTDLSTVEFSEYCEKCIRLGAEMGIVIPTPDEAESEKEQSKAGSAGGECRPPPEPGPSADSHQASPKS
jgi:hypothetical protein